jgi:uncharacterized protein (TIGR00369 family)
MKEDFFAGFNDNPFHKYLGLTLVEVRPDHVRLRLVKTETTPTGIAGSVNGGVVATMVDMAGVAAVFSNLNEGTVPAGTADLNVTYLRQAQGAWVDAKAEVIKRGKQLCTVEVSIVNEDGQVSARGRVLYAFKAAPA